MDIHLDTIALLIILGPPAIAAAFLFPFLKP
jgi:hypothetical protein